MADPIGISKTDMERMKALTLAGTPALVTNQLYSVDGSIYKWTGTDWTLIAQGSAVKNVVTLTQAQYNALTPVDGTLYVING